MHRHFSILLVLATAGCSIDKFLEGEQPPDATHRAGSFAPARSVLSVIGAGSDVVSHGMNYLTTPECTVNPMYTGVFGSGNLLSGVPGVLQRDTDYHQVIVTSIGGGRARVAAWTFHTMLARTLVLPALITSLAVSTVSAPYKILEANAGFIALAYDGHITLRYAGTRSMSVSAPREWFSGGPIVLAFPNLSGVDGWPAGAAMGPGESGTWNFSAEGGSRSPHLCVDLRLAFSFAQQGTF